MLLKLVIRGVETQGRGGGLDNAGTKCSFLDFKSCFGVCDDQPFATVLDGHIVLRITPLTHVQTSCLRLHILDYCTNSVNLVSNGITNYCSDTS